MKFNKKEKEIFKKTKEGAVLFWKIGFNWFTLVVSLISGIFWAWLWLSFIRFGFMSIFGLYGAMSGDYTLALQTIIEQQRVWNILTWGIALMMVILNLKFERTHDRKKEQNK